MNVDGIEEYLREKAMEDMMALLLEMIKHSIESMKNPTLNGLR